MVVVVAGAGGVDRKGGRGSNAPEIRGSDTQWLLVSAPSRCEAQELGRWIEGVAPRTRLETYPLFLLCRASKRGEGGEVGR